jgi:hypothetical protein
MNFEALPVPDKVGLDQPGRLGGLSLVEIHLVVQEEQDAPAENP